jgi:acetylglutamate kinase
MSYTLLKQSKPKMNIEQLSPTAEDGESLSGQVVVVKFGGSAVLNEHVLDTLIDDTLSLVKQGVKVIVVHGGGTAVNDAVAAAGKKTEKVNGLRVTDSETLAIAVATFVDLNEKLTEKFRAKGGCALGFSSKSANPFLTEKMGPVYKDEKRFDLGWVGEILSIDTRLLESWLYAGWLPIIPPLGLDNEGHYYNINADHAALAIASALQSDALFFLTDVPGVLSSVSDPTSRIKHLTPSAAESYIKSGAISGGMLPKIKSCLAGIKNGVGKIAILNSFDDHSLLNGFNAPEEIGTLITGEPSSD